MKFKLRSKRNWTFLCTKGPVIQIQGPLHIKISMSDSHRYLISRDEAYITKLRISCIGLSIEQKVGNRQN